MAQKSEHLDKDGALNPSKAERIAARDRVKADGSTDAAFILAGEADKGSDDSEPDVVP